MGDDHSSIAPSLSEVHHFNSLKALDENLCDWEHAVYAFAHDNMIGTHPHVDALSNNSNEAQPDDPLVVYINFRSCSNR